MSEQTIRHWLTLARRRWHRVGRVVACWRGRHKEELVDVFGVLRWVCLDCPHARDIGQVRPHASNHLHHHGRERTDDA